MTVKVETTFKESLIYLYKLQIDFWTTVSVLHNVLNFFPLIALLVHYWNSIDGSELYFAAVLKKETLNNK